jgi:hypothetical protein
MRMLFALFMTLFMTLAASLSTTVQAQLPFPFEPQPDFNRPRQCSRDYIRSVENLVTALEKLRTAGPEAVGRMCTLVEMGRAWLGGELPDDMRRELRGLLGVDVDLKRLSEQCRAGQDGIAQELATKLRQLRAEIVRCDDTI